MPKPGAGGEAARLAHEAVTSAFRAHVREREPHRYDALLKDFREKTAAALPSTDPAFIPGLASGRAASVVPEARQRSVENAIAFLQADPWFFRSGYESRTSSVTSSARSSPSHNECGSRASCWRRIDGRDRVEFRHFGRLACGSGRIAGRAVAARMQSGDPGVRRRATWVVAAAISAGRCDCMLASPAERAGAIGDADDLARHVVRLELRQHLAEQRVGGRGSSTSLRMQSRVVTGSAPNDGIDGRGSDRLLWTRKSSEGPYPIGTLHTLMDRCRRH